MEKSQKCITVYRLRNCHTALWEFTLKKAKQIIGEGRVTNQA